MSGLRGHIDWLSDSPEFYACPEREVLSDFDNVRDDPDWDVLIDQGDFVVARYLDQFSFWAGAIRKDLEDD